MTSPRHLSRSPIPHSVLWPLLIQCSGLSWKPSYHGVTADRGGWALGLQPLPVPVIKRSVAL